MLKQLIKITAFVGMLSYLGLAQAADLFSDEWMKAFMEEWNNESALSGALAKIDFNSKIAYGFKGEDNPRGVLIVEDGKGVKAGACDGGDVMCDNLNWDLRATPEEWQDWFKNGIGKVDLMKPGFVGGLKFETGNYMKMMTTPSMWGPFVKSFAVMGRVK